MKTIQSVKTNFGRYAYALETTIGDEVNDGTTKLVIGEALPNLGFRAVGSEVEKALVAAKVMTKDTKRSEVAYTLDTSKVIAEAAQKKLDEVCKKEGYPAISFLPLGEHVFGEGSDKPTKEATEMWTKVQGFQGEKFTKALALLGLKEEDYSDESGVLACKVYIQKTRKEAMEKAAAALEIA